VVWARAERGLGVYHSIPVWGVKIVRGILGEADFGGLGASMLGEWFSNCDLFGSASGD